MRVVIRHQLLQTVMSVVGLKSCYQFIYVVFSLMVVQKLKIDEYGNYAYILALVIYFSAIPMLGLPIYLQKTSARREPIDIKYLIVASCNGFLGALGAFALMPKLGLIEQLGILCIILFNTSLAFLVPVYDGSGRYTFQYKFLFFSSIWMGVCLFQALVLKLNLSLLQIIHYWMINAILALTLIIVVLYKTMRSRPFYRGENTYRGVFFELLFLYAIAVPDGFAKFIDRFTAHQFLSESFLGAYAFNLMLVMTVYAFFIRPINTVLFTELAKHTENQAKITEMIIKYFIYGFSFYACFGAVYLHTNTQLLQTLHLNQYLHTEHLFKYCLGYAILYFCSLPFTALLTLTATIKIRTIYCMLSLMIFSFPLFTTFYLPSTSNFLRAFFAAYTANLFLVILLQRKTAIRLLKAFPLLFMHIKLNSFRNS